MNKIISRKDMINCVLCNDAPCAAACLELDAAGLLGRIWFDNEDRAVKSLPADDPCAACDAPCEDKYRRDRDLA